MSKDVVGQRARFCVAMVIASAAVACSSGGSSSSPNATDSGGASVGDPSVDGGSAKDGDASASGSSGQSANGALKILSLTSTVPTVTGGRPTKTESNSVTFIAIVTDSKGLEAIAGGQLVDDEGKSYSAFGAGANKGTYTTQISFDEINKIRSIDFSGTSGTRTFSAKFFDNDGNVATSPLTVTFACRGGDESTLLNSCGGVCLDQQIEGDHCGACGTQCSASMVCSKGACTKPAAVDSTCFDARSVATGTSCDTLCVGDGMACATNVIGKAFVDSSCTDGEVRNVPCLMEIRDVLVGNSQFQSGRGFMCRCK